MNSQNKELSFRISSGLKNLIGRDLISDLNWLKILMMPEQVKLQFPLNSLTMERKELLFRTMVAE